MSSEPSDFSKQPQSPEQPLEQSAAREFCEPAAQDLVLKAAEESCRSEESNTGEGAKSGAAALLSLQNPAATASSALGAPHSVSGSEQALAKPQATPDSLNQPRLDGASKDNLLNTLGNPHASEADWINAAEKLGDNPARSQQPMRKSWTVFFVLLALFISILGYSIVSIFSSSQPVPPAVEGTAPTTHALAVSPKPPPTVSPNADVDFGTYMADLQRRIKRAWFPPKGEESKRVVVDFKVHDDGSLSNLKLEKSSGAMLADRAALKAVEDAAPFKPLPVGASKDVDIQFTFDYNVFNGPKKNGTAPPGE